MSFPRELVHEPDSHCRLPQRLDLFCPLALALRAQPFDELAASRCEFAQRQLVEAVDLAFEVRLGSGSHRLRLPLSYLSAACSQPATRAVGAAGIEPATSRV